MRDFARRRARSFRQCHTISLELLDDMPLLVWHVRDRARLRMLPAVQLLLGLRIAYRPALLCLCFHELGHVVVPFDALDFRQTLELLHELFPVSRGLLFPIDQHTELLVRLRFPNADVCVLGAREHEARVGREDASKHPLHALRMVHVPGSLAVDVPQSNGLIVARRSELLASRAIRDVKHSLHVVPVPPDGLRQFPHVKGIQVAVLVRDSEIHGLHWIPTNGVGLHFQKHLANGGIAPEIVKADRPVHSRRSDKRGLCRIEPRCDHPVASPFKGAQWSRAIVVPYIDCVARRHEHRLGPMVVNGVWD
mmetsp:Transcript_73334/g.203480  ORF Transcript_73334/g.203480 Transcript_73334/m.203480 type:complete len:308 (+) Transcript_73334:43-966(+)